MRRVRVVVINLLSEAEHTTHGQTPHNCKDFGWVIAVRTVARSRRKGGVWVSAPCGAWVKKLSARQRGRVSEYRERRGRPAVVDTYFDI